MSKERQHPFATIPAAQYNETVYQLLAEYHADATLEKINLMVGVYHVDEGGVYTLPSVIEAKKRLFDNAEWRHGYRPSQIGTPGYLRASTGLFFGEDSPIVRDGRVAVSQSLGASGACHMAAILLKQHYAVEPTIFLPPNHANVFEHVGLRVGYLPYFDESTANLDFPSFCSAIDKLAPNSVLVLQTSGQNPTGCDPSDEQWAQLAETCLVRGHLIIFDAAYYGMATGSVCRDTQGIRICAEANVPIMVAATYSKAFGLYSERVGVLCVTAPDQEICRRLEMQLRLITRYEAGGFPAFGADIVELILTSPDLRAQWQNDVAQIAAHLQRRRSQLQSTLEDLKTPGDWQSITRQQGMFCLLGFSEHQLALLRTVHHVYLQDNGRLSVSGLNSANIERVSRSIDAVVRMTGCGANEERLGRNSHE